MANWGRGHTGLAIRYFLQQQLWVFLCVYCYLFFLSRIPFLQRLLKFLDPVDSSFSCFHCAESGQCTTISRARIEEISLFVCKPSGEENSPNDLNEKAKNEAEWPTNLFLP